MKKILGTCAVSLMAVALLGTGSVSAAEAAKVVGAPASGDAESLTSLKKKGAVKIGGEVVIDTIWSHRDDGDPDGNGVMTDAEDGDRVDSTNFNTYDAYLEVDVEMAPDATLNVLLDLDDFNDGSADNGDLLEECYFQWDNKFGGAWSFGMGKKGVDYGSCNTVGITTSMQEDGNCAWLSDREKAGGGSSNAHTTVGSNSFGAAATGPTDLFVFDAAVKVKDMLRFYGAVFQADDGMNEDRSNDHLGFQSYAGKIDFTPVEGLTLSASVINYHNDSMGDGDTRFLAGEIANLGQATSDQTATAWYAEYDLEPKYKVPLLLFTQYQHAWDVNYNDDTSADIFSLQAIYGLTEKLDLGVMGEYAHIDDATMFNDEDYWLTAVNLTYTTSYDLSFGVEYAYAAYEGDYDGLKDVDRDAHIIAFRTAYSF